MRYASIVPLIGGPTIAMENVFGKRPTYILTYEGFQDNETHLLNYYNHSVPYLNLSDGVHSKLAHPLDIKMDVVNTVCPCAGLSSLSPYASSTNEANDWMIKSAQYILGTIKPKVFWGENAPRLASKMGEPVVKKLRKIGEANGYTFSIFKTKSILHGLGQVRDRAFYFFWEGDKVPLLDYIWQPYERIEDTIRNTKKRLDDPMSQMLTNENIPSKNPFYKYILEEIEGGISHKHFQRKIERSVGILDYIEQHTNYKEVAKWMRERGYDNEAKKCDRMYHKLKAGGNIMRKTVEIPKDYIGAFVGHMPTNLTHPDEDRYLTVREALSIMKLPNDFQLLNAKRTLNHMCQNVPVTTAEHPARMVKKYLEGNLDLIDTNFLIQDNKKKTIDYEKSPLQLDQFMI